MGQALRRSIGRFPARTRPPPPHPPPHPPQPPHPPPPQNTFHNPEQVSPPPYEAAVASRDRLGVSSPEDTSEINVDGNNLEERDREYDAMLRKMAGTIRSKPGGKQEMGEALIVQKYKRPLPKIRSSVEESGSHDQKSKLPGTLTIAQLQEIMLLHQGKSADHKGPMDIQDISKKFGVDAAQLEQIVQFLSLPTEHDEKDTNKSN